MRTARDLWMASRDTTNVAFSASRDENSFDAVQRTAADAHTLPDLEKGMGTVG